ncbi:class I SAM-dependent methyltransferase [Micromonospora ureilytica]|uniref:class I SAM-dependent methyltransferase n=1 Tax=Micromonospora ureilytica TaxID=709868 RepID=UPI00340F1D4B
MYGSQSSDVYEFVHRGRGKDYRAEAEEVYRQIRARRPDARTLLDVACGTGAHLRHFRELFDGAEGLELSEAMAGAATRLMPGVVVHAGDMRDFRLGHRYDAITCMFGSIGYARDEEELRRTLAGFAAHLTPGGVVAIDPWWFPDTYLDGHVSGDVVSEDGRTVARVSHSVRDGDASRMDVHYVLADAGGARHFVEQHVISLFGRTQYEAAFQGAGLTVEYLPDLHSGRGLFIGADRAGHPSRSTPTSQ